MSLPTTPTPNPHLISNLNFKAKFPKFDNIILFWPQYFNNWMKNLHLHIQFHLPNLQLSKPE